MISTDVEARIARAIRYMETHAGTPFPMEEAAEEACWSLFHFHRVFTACVGMGPAEYLRRRRLADAAEALALGKESVRAIAGRSGFATAASFGRAFRQAFSLSPAAYRRASTGARLLNPFGPVERPTFMRPQNLTEDPMVVPRGSTRLAVLGFSCPLESAEMGPRIAAFWKGPVRRVLAAPECVPGLTYGLAMPDPERPGQCIRYLAGAALKEDAVAPLWAEPFEVPQGRYLRAVSRGDHALIKDAWLYLYGYWLPREGMEPGGTLDFDVFHASDPTAMELYLPLKDRKK